MSDLQDFHAETLPLTGLRLIEASAGTGKTFNLAGLYLRLITEENASVRDILVMTFTRAATQELRERIRSRLARAALIAHDRQQADPDNPEDAFTCRIIDKFVDSEAQKQLARRLAEAAGRVDEATITTIHGFAQRAATENAFDSALAFDRGEPVDDPEIHRQMTADYWREQVFDVSGANNTVLNFWDSAEALYQDIRTILDKPHARLLQASQEHIEHLLAQLGQLWPQACQPLTELLGQLWDSGLLNQGCLKDALSEDGDPQITMARLDATIQQALADQQVPVMAPWVVKLAEPSSQISKKSPKKQAAYLDAFQQLQPVLDVLAELQPLAYTLAIQHAATQIKQRSLSYKAEHRLYSYDDLIAALYEALHEPRTGDRLAAALQQRWPYALVDEFQDTDPLQYANLRRIYLDNPGDDGALLLIGDPKQAIYGFRGGDIYAYLDAAQAAGQQRYTLARNFRSTQNLLNAIEALYRQPESQPFRVAAIDFPSIEAGRPADDRRLIHTSDGSELAALTLWQLEGNTKTRNNGNICNPRKKHDEALLRQKTVETIARLLHTDDIQWQDADGQRRAIQPHDIAILVNQNHQAVTLQNALAQAGIRAVCQQQASVYGSDEAAELQLLLRSMLEPDNARAVRAAQTGTLLGKRLADLIALADDDQALQQAVAQFHELHEAWRRRGILSALEQLFIQAGPRILSLADGERRMTNFLQLGELLAHTEAETFGMASLLHRLDEKVQEARQGTPGQEDSNQLRLESDAELVRISTVHAAKGLEYPIVFMPFAPWLGQQWQPHKPPLVFHQPEYNADNAPDNPAWIDLIGARQAHIDQAVNERYSEALRLLYVALTRAEQALFLGWREPDSYPGKAGALADLLYRDTAPPGQAMQQLVAQHNDCMTLEILDAKHYSPRIPTAPLASADSLGPARQQLPRPRPRWSTYSFSRLAHAPVVEAGAIELPEAGAMDETHSTASVLTLPEDDPAVPALDIRLGGVNFGSAVHDLLETQLQPHPRPLTRWPKPGQTPDPEQQRLVYETLRRYGLIADDPKDPRISDTSQLVARTLHTPLPHIGTLAALPSQQIRTEMEFMFRMGGNQLGALAQTLHAHGYLATPLGGHASQTLYGLMQGFIDLTVEIKGQYYILDYKTNRLGETISAYQGAALQQAISRAHYDLQYLIYAVALHRHLQRSLGQRYDPAFHLGGVQYLFVRALDGHSDTGIFTDALDPELIQKLDSLFAQPVAF